MSNTIQLKRSSTASDTPTASDLAVGELAVNTADAKLFTKHTDNSIKEISSGSGGSGISNVVEDTTPELGGDLSLGNKALTYNDQDVIEGVSHSGKNSVRFYSDGVERGRTTGEGFQSMGGFQVRAVNSSGAGTLYLSANSSALNYERGIFNLRNAGSQSEIRMYCESSNAHYAALKAPAHSAFSGNVDLTLPATTGTIALTSSDITGNAATATTATSATNSDTVDNKHISVVSSLPASPDANTIYFVTS